jgi:hypothetical protein
MARKTTPAVQQHDDVDQETLNQGVVSLRTVANNGVTVAQMMGYDLVYDRERIVQEARFFMAQSAEAMLEAGKRLVMLKENEGHGKFLEIVEQQLGLQPRTAQLMMQAAVKYLGTPELTANTNMFSQLGKSKLFELMTLDNDALIELSEGGSIAGLTLDDVDRMSVRELKAALRDARADITAKDTVIAGKAATITKMQTQQAKLQPPTPDEDVAKLRRETSDYAFQTEAIIRGSLREGIGLLSQNDIETGASQGEFVAGLLAQLERAIAEVRSEFGVKAQPDGDPRPEWDKDR